MKKILLFGLPTLVTLLVLLPTGNCLPLFSAKGYSASEYQLHPGHVITVDDDGDGNYTSIKEAVNHASAGDVIEVYSGTYNEYNISITTPDITLQGIPYELGNGNSTGKPFIKGKGLDNVIVIWADGVIVSGFHIENYGNGLVTTLCIATGNHCVVSDNYLTNALLGYYITCGNCSNCSILNNTVSGYENDYPGIGVGFPSSYITISGNVITGTFTGIQLWDSPHNIVTRNTIRKCGYAVGILNGDNNTVSLNNLENNSVGIDASGNNIIITHNNFINNKKQATFSIPLIDWHNYRYIKWIGNYWNHTRILPQFIFGQSWILPWFNIDWRPALKPFDI